MRAIVLYLLLVGMPVLGILGLLQVGETLSAPTSLAGTWNAQLTRPRPSQSIAAAEIIEPGSRILNISQSGPHVVLTFDDNHKTTLSGDVQDMIVSASVRLPHAQAIIDESSSGTAAIYFSARVDRQDDPDRLRGVLIFEEGLSRTEVPLSAIRQSGDRQRMDRQ